MRNKVLAIVAAGLLAGPMAAQAALITSQVAGASVIDFSNFDIGTFTFTAGPVEVAPGVVFTASYNRSGFGGGPYNFGDNGRWGDPTGPDGRNGYAFTNCEDCYITFTFASALTSVGGFVNYGTGESWGSPGTPYLEVLDFGGAVLESYDLSVVAPIDTLSAANEGAFRGIARAEGDIYGFRLRGGFLAIDDLEYYTTTSVPEPGSLALLGLGLAGLGFARRRRLN